MRSQALCHNGFRVDLTKPLRHMACAAIKK